MFMPGRSAARAGLHFLIAFGARRRAIVPGLLYGIPLPAFPQGPFSMAGTVTGVIAHMLFIGLPISLAVRRYST